jgi:hypothetical protein
MGNTPFSKRCEILADAWTDFSKEGWSDFFSTYNLGLPLAFAQHNDLADVSADGATYVDQTWEALCKELRVSHNEKYNSLNDLLDSISD